MVKIFSLKQIETLRLIIRPVALGDEISLYNLIHNSLSLLQEWLGLKQFLTNHILSDIIPYYEDNKNW